MHTHADKTTQTNSNAVANGMRVQQSAAHEIFQFEDNRPETIAQRKIQDAVNNSPQVTQLKAIQAMANNSPRVKQLRAVQAIAADHNPSVIQRQISYDPIGTQFEIDGTRPSFVDAATKIKIKNGESVDHIIPFKNHTE